MEQTANIISELNQISEDTKKTFGNLSFEQINWKSSAESWSIGQCFEHLIVTNKMEMIAIEKALQGEHTKSIWERMPILPSVFGKLLIKMVNPKSTRKFKAPKNFRPVQSSIKPQIIDEYIETSNKIISLMKASQNLDISKMIITSPIPRISYSLFDAYKVIALHDRRHFLQAERVLKIQV